LFGGLEPTDVKGPLVQFQAARFEPDDMKRLVKMMNVELGETALTADVFESVFEMWWPRLAEQVGNELDQHSTEGDETSRSERDILEEVLALTRTMSRDGRSRDLDMDHPVFEDLTMSVLRLVRLLKSKPVDDEIFQAIIRVVRPLDYIVKRGGRAPGREVRGLMMELEGLLSKAAEPRPTSESAADPPA
jgi:hypothetical protein